MHEDEAGGHDDLEHDEAHAGVRERRDGARSVPSQRRDAGDEQVEEEEVGEHAVGPLDVDPGRTTGKQLAVAERESLAGHGCAAGREGSGHADVGGEGAERDDEESEGPGGQGDREEARIARAAGREASVENAAAHGDVGEGRQQGQGGHEMQRGHAGGQVELDGDGPEQDLDDDERAGEERGSGQSAGPPQPGVIAMPPRENDDPEREQAEAGCQDPVAELDERRQVEAWRQGPVAVRPVIAAPQSGPGNADDAAVDHEDVGVDGAGEAEPAEATAAGVVARGGRGGNG